MWKSQFIVFTPFQSKVTLFSEQWLSALEVFLYGYRRSQPSLHAQHNMYVWDGKNKIKSGGNSNGAERSK